MSRKKFKKNAATITASASEDTNVLEAGVDPMSVVVAGDADAGGTLTVSDVDAGEDVFQAVASADLQGTYGAFTFDEVTGEWSYELDDADVDTQALDLGDIVFDTLDVVSADGTATETISVTINGTNDNPIANDDAIAVTEQQVLTFDAIGGVSGVSGVVADTDAEGHTLTITGGADAGDSSTAPLGITLGSGGSTTLGGAAQGGFTTDWGALVTLNSNGLIEYNLTGTSGAYQELGAGDTAVDTFTYDISDGNGGTSTATVSVTITGFNDAPIAQDITVLNGAEDSAINILPDFVDVDASDSHTFTVNTSGTLGLVTVNANGSFDYDPNGQFEGLDDGETATDSFDYTVIDSSGLSSVQTVTITINGANDAPVVSGNVDLGVVVEDNSIIIAEADLLANATDVDVEGLSVINLMASSGMLVANPGGRWTFTPDLNDDTDVTFSYDVSDGTVDTAATASLDITPVNDAAVITGDVSGTSVEDGVAITGTLFAADVDNSSLFIPVSTAVATTYGEFTVDDAGEWTYTLDDANSTVDALNVGDSLTDSFVVQSEDGTSQTVTITIDGANDAPVLVGPLIESAAEDDAFFAVDLLSGASDVDSSGLSIVAGSVTGLQKGVILAGSTLNVDPSDSVFQSLPAGVTETITIGYDIIDGDGGLVAQTATITIIGTNDVPVVGGVSTGDVVEDNTTPATGTLTISDVDAGESVFAVITASDPSDNGFGSFEVLPDGTWTYTLDSSNASVQALEIGETTTDSITVSSADGTASVVLTVTITGAINFIVGTAGADVITGQFDEDDIRAGDSDDIVDAGSGVDVVQGQDGNDMIFGGDGDDRLFGQDGEDQQYGGDGADRLFGGDGDDALNGDAGVDDLRGEAGDDTLAGGADDDILRGGDGDDELSGYTGADRLIGGDGADILSGGDDNDRLLGGDGADQLSGDSGNDILFGQEGDDVLFGGLGDDGLIGGDGDDDLSGDAGDDRLFGDAGDDDLSGGDGADILVGGLGDEILDGDAGDDRLFGGDGEDDLSGGDGADTLFGEAGDDILDGEAGDDRLFGGDGDDVINGADGDDTLGGQNGDDLLLGGTGDDDLRGDAGDDRLVGQDGDDVLSGGDGEDTLRGDDGADTLNGDAGNDVLFGQNGDDVLFGDAGDDRLIAGNGDDMLSGGTGNDILFGQSGDDTFVFTAGDGFDRIRDFDDDGNDNIDLSAFGFSSFADIAAVMTQVGAHVQIDFGNGDILRLDNTDLADMGADDFLF